MKTSTKIVASVMSLSASGLLAIAGFEGFSDTAYIPVAGDVPTIGFGSTEGVNLGDKITVTDALGLLNKDTAKAQDAVRRLVKVPISQEQFDVYVSFVFNLGEGNFANSTLLKKLNAGDHEGSCRELKRWICGPDPSGKYSQIYPDHQCGIGKAPLPGLVARRKTEFQLCMKGVVK